MDCFCDEERGVWDGTIKSLLSWTAKVIIFASTVLKLLTFRKVKTSNIVGVNTTFIALLNYELHSHQNLLGIRWYYETSIVTIDWCLIWFSKLNKLIENIVFLVSWTVNVYHTIWVKTFFPSSNFFLSKRLLSSNIDQSIINAYVGGM